MSSVRTWANCSGGSADLTGSNNTFRKDSRAVTANDAERQLHQLRRARVRDDGDDERPVRCTAAYRPYAGTFLVFSDYARNAVRLAALMRQGVILVYTHDSIGLGEDGPTHQPIEHVASLRLMPNLWSVASLRRGGDRCRLGWPASSGRTARRLWC